MSEIGRSNYTVTLRELYIFVTSLQPTADCATICSSNRSSRRGTVLDAFAILVSAEDSCRDGAAERQVFRPPSEASTHRPFHWAVSGLGAYNVKKTNAGLISDSAQENIHDRSTGHRSVQRLRISERGRRSARVACLSARRGQGVCSRVQFRSTHSNVSSRCCRHRTMVNTGGGTSNRLRHCSFANWISQGSLVEWLRSGLFSRPTGRGVIRNG
jgi:hypothetical protein